MKKPSTQSTVFPFDYNKNNPTDSESFNNWALSVKQDLMKDYKKLPVARPKINESEAMENLLDIAKEVLTLIPRKR